jgi:hypothetical protein
MGAAVRRSKVTTICRSQANSRTAPLVAEVVDLGLAVKRLILQIFSKRKQRGQRPCLQGAQEFAPDTMLASLAAEAGVPGAGFGGLETAAPQEKLFLQRRPR